MEERVFLDDSGIRVTSARFIVQSQTFAMSGITSVKAVDVPPSQGGPVLILILGILVLTIGLSAKVIPIAAFGAILGIWGGLWLASQKPTYNVILTTAGGEVKALSSPSRDVIYGVVEALNDSIVHRG